jgi:hypothetical protein
MIVVNPLIKVHSFPFLIEALEMRVRDSILVSFSGDEELFYRNGSSGQLKAYLRII